MFQPAARHPTLLQGFCIMLAVAGVMCAQISFDAPRVYPTGIGSSPYAVAVGDFNGDGKPDLAAALDTGRVAILLGAGDGVFRSGASYKVPGGVLESIAIGDFNGDGKLDLAVTGSEGSVSILLGNGDGTFQSSGNYSVGPFPWIAISADFNRDGKLDLAVSTDGGFAILVGNGDGTFQSPVYHALSNSTYYLAVGDFNRDGNPDLVAAGQNTLTILLGNGDGTFQPPANIAFANPGYVAVGDFNGDGKPDLAVTSSLSNLVSILLGNGDGTFQRPVNDSLTAPAWLAAADFNGDGKLDLAVTTANVSATNYVLILLGNGDGTFQPPASYIVNSGALATGDFNGDGKPDLAVASTFYAISVLLNKGDGTFPQLAQFPVPQTTGITAMIVADLNRDGHPDLALTNPPYVTILLGNGQGAFQPPVNYSTGTIVNALAAGDFNGDGKLDLAVTSLGSTGCSFPPCPAISQKPPGLYILLGNGDGTFQPPTFFAIGGMPDAVAVGDFNGDGKLDLVIGNGKPAAYISIMLGNGDGTFRAPLLSTTNGYSSAVATADFNGDGKADVAVVNKSGSVAILLGNGDGTFQQLTLYGVPSPVGAPDALAIGDFNGDGKPDLAVAKDSSQVGVAVMIGNGDGTFQLPVNYSANAGAPGWAGGVVAADFKGDGFEDLAVVSSGSNLTIYAGKGDGTFGPAQYFGPACGAYLAVGDFTRPGRPDLVSWFGPGISILTDTTP